VEAGAEGDQTRLAFLYYASLLATPLKTLSNSLVFSGNNQNVGGQANNNNAVTLYNTAQLYRGITMALNLGVSHTSEDQETGGSQTHTDAYVNPGINITPSPTMTLTFYYLGKKSYLSGVATGSSSDITENRFDVGASWTPVRTVFLSASVSSDSTTGQMSSLQQNYGLNWNPFPDGQLQFSFIYTESYLPGRSTIIQPSLRWYVGAKRRSYLDLSYQFNTTESGGQKIETNIVSSTLKIFF